MAPAFIRSRLELGRDASRLVSSQPVGLVGSLPWRRPYWNAEHPEPETAMGFVYGCVVSRKHVGCVLQ